MIAWVRRAWSALAKKFGPWRIDESSGMWVSGGRDAASGVTVSEEGSLSLSAVFAAVNLLSRVTASLPLQVYRRSGRNKMPATAHPSWRVLHLAPNSEMSSATWRRTMEFHRLLWGNCYSEIQWAGSGAVRAVWPVEPWRVKPDRDADGRLYYLVDRKRKVAPEDMLHLTLISTDGVVGQSFIDYALESLGLGLATQEFAARYFGNGARPGAILKHPGSPTPSARAEMRRSWDQRHGGPTKAGGTAVLWGGWEYSSDGSFDPEKSQLLEQRRFTIEEVARWLNIPPHLLRDLSRATFSNIEHQGIDFVSYSLGPTLVEYEQEYDRKLLAPPDLYSKHNVAALLRGDAAARSAYYREMFNIGVLSINDILELEDRNPIPDGDTHFVPLNLAPIERVLAEEEEPPEETPPPPPPENPPPEEPEEPNGQAEGMRVLLASTLTRLAAVEHRAILRAAEKPGRFLAWMDEFYPAQEGRLVSALTPVAEAASLVSLSLVEPATIAASWCERSRTDLLDLTDRVTSAQLSQACQNLLSSGWSRRVDLMVAECIWGK